MAEAFERLTNGELSAFRLGVIHGRMSSSEKEQSMADFRTGRRGARFHKCDRSRRRRGKRVCDGDPFRRAFRLAQLHQLRGRVGRGLYAGFCGVLVSETLSPQARARLEAFASTADGFQLAEMDFECGPGDLFGTQQHGLPPLRIADLRRDQQVVEQAREKAQQLFAADPGLKLPQHARLRRQMLVRYGGALELGDVG